MEIVEMQDPWGFGLKDGDSVQRLCSLPSDTNQDEFYEELSGFNRLLSILTSNK